MSSTLTMEPDNRKKKALPYELKKVLQKKFNGIIHERLVDEGDLTYISALVDMEIAGAQELYDFIEKHGRVVLNEDF